VGIRYFAIKASRSHAAPLSASDFSLVSHGFENNSADVPRSSGSRALVATQSKVCPATTNIEQFWQVANETFSYALIFSTKGLTFYDQKNELLS